MFSSKHAGILLASGDIDPKFHLLPIVRPIQKNCRPTNVVPIPPVMPEVVSIYESKHAGILLASGDIDPKLEYGPCAVFLLYHDESIDFL